MVYSAITTTSCGCFVRSGRRSFELVPDNVIFPVLLQEPSLLCVNFFVAAAAPWPTGAVVARLAQRHAALRREVAEQARQEQSQHTYGRPAHAAVRLAAREGLVRAHVLVVAGTVVEQAFDAAHASDVVHRRRGRAKAPAAAHPTRRQGPRAGAPFALAAAAVLAAVRVLAFAGSGAKRCRQGLELVLFQLRALGLRPHDPLDPGVSQKSLLRRRAPRAGPGGAARSVAGAADGPAHAAPRGLLRSLLAAPLGPRGVPALGGLAGGRAGRLRVRFLLGGGRSRRHRRALRVLIAAADGPDLVQGEHLTLPGLRVPGLGPAGVTLRSQQARRAAATILSSRLHLYSEVGTLWLALNTSEVLWVRQTVKEEHTRKLNPIN